MGLSTVAEIERAIGDLSPNELEDLRAWLDQFPHAFDNRIQADLAAGRLDEAIARALNHEAQGNVKPL